MYLGVDVGGTKTLVAVFDDTGVITEQKKFPTPEHYSDFLKELKGVVYGFSDKNYTAAAIALPGRLDRGAGRLVRLANLEWQAEDVVSDCQNILSCSVLIENDANMAALYEAKQWPDYDKVLYVTISTGIGTGFTLKQHLDQSLLDMEGGQILLPHEGKLTRWELFASGKAIQEHFGKQASDIDPSDKEAWQYVVDNLAIGLFANIAIIEPDLIVIGGGVGAYFDRFGKMLQTQLNDSELRVVKIPKLVKAERPEEAVVYGCFELASQKPQG